MEDDAVVLPAADERAKAKNAQLEFLDIQARLDQQLARDRTSFDTIQGELAKLTSMVSQLANSLAKHSPSAHTSTPAASAIAPASVVSQVFGEMPTPSSCPRTYGTSLKYCQGQRTPSQNSCLQSVSTGLNWQNLDEMPQAYGLHNLNRRSVFVADGSEHIYYALPDTYPLERAVPEPVFDVYDDESDGCSNEFVQVFSGTLEQQIYEVEQHESRQAPECFSKPTFSPGRPTVGTEGAFSFTNEKESDNELLAVSFNNASDNAFREEATYLTFPHAPVIHADRSIKLNNENSTQATSTLCVHEAIVHCHDDRPEHINGTKGLEIIQLNFEQEDILISGAVSNVVNSEAWEFVAPRSHCINHAKQRLLWDPGASAICVTPLNNGSSKDTIGNEHVRRLVGSTGVFNEAMLDIPPSKPPEKHGSVDSSLHGIVLKTEKSVEQIAYLAWDPGPGVHWYEIMWLTNLIKGHNHAVVSEVNASAVLVLAVPHSEVTPLAKHYLFLLSQEYHMMLITKGTQEWDPGIGTASSIDRWFCSNQDILCGVALWLIHFQPP